jgi:putative acyl-CoA dehydrogenase
MRLCRSFDQPASPAEAARARLLTPAVKYLVCKSAPALLTEAMECLGGNGYVEEGTLARLYREAPVNAIWEGSGNVMALDVLRVFSRERDGAQATLTELARDANGLPGATEAVRAIGQALGEGEASARIAIERLAELAVAAALNQSAPQIAELYARRRLAAPGGSTLGTAVFDANATKLLLGRALPEL